MKRLEEVLLITGPLGSGKSTLARYIAERLDWKCISEDAYWVRHSWSGTRTEEQERIVQAEVTKDLISAVRGGHHVVLEFILYKEPPNPLASYQGELVGEGISFETLVLRPSSLNEIMKRLKQRGRPNDLAKLEERRREMEHQVTILQSASIQPAFVVDPADMTVEAIYNAWLSQHG
jgi:adenylate kinase family enzyme